MEASLSKRVEEWVEGKPCIRYALSMGIVNYSALAREIMEKEGIKNFDAVVVALRRYKEKLGRIGSIGKKQMEILKASTIEIKTGINVYVMSKTLWRKEELLKSKEYSHLIEGYDFYVLITEEKVEGAGIVSKEENVVEVRIKSPEAIETTPGIVLLIYQKLFEYGINIIETYSCWRDTVMLVKRKDVESLLKALGELGVK